MISTAKTGNTALSMNNKPGNSNLPEVGCNYRGHLAVRVWTRWLHNRERFDLHSQLRASKHVASSQLDLEFVNRRRSGPSTTFLAEPDSVYLVRYSGVQHRSEFHRRKIPLRRGVLLGLGLPESCPDFRSGGRNIGKGSGQPELNLL